MEKWRYSSTILDLGTSPSRPCRFTLGEIGYGSSWLAGWVGPRAGLVSAGNRAPARRCIVLRWGNFVESGHLEERPEMVVRDGLRFWQCWTFGFSYHRRLSVLRTTERQPNWHLDWSKLVRRSKNALKYRLCCSYIIDSKHFHARCKVNDLSGRPS
jgi:hypothetical protein